MRSLFLLLFIASLSIHASDLKNELASMVTEAHYPLKYRDAKKILYNELFLRPKGLVEDVYCGKLFPLGSGGINVEHSWPKSHFNKKVKQDIQAGDLHHLFPVDAQVNSHRGNDPYGDVEGTAVNPNCQLSHSGLAIGSKDVYAFEPPDQYKGDIARAQFYFSIRYRMAIDPMQEAFLRLWHYLDFVDEDELWRNDMIEKVQGNRNPFIDYPEYVIQIEDF